MRERLYRSRRDRMIGGIAGGMAQNLAVDSTWIRLGWVVLAFVTGGLAILIYLALLFVIPEAPPGLEDGGTTVASTTWPGSTSDAGPGSATGSDQPPRAPFERMFGPGSSQESSRNVALIFGLILVAAGAWLLLRRFVPFAFDIGWPVIVIAAGVILVVVALRPRARP